MQTSKTLSRNELYAPLSSFKTTQVDPISIAVQQPSMLMGLHTDSLAEFVSRAGVNYHRHHANSRDAKNNGSRPLTLDTVRERLSQRSLTLVGGGISSVLASPVRRKKRKVKRRRFGRFAETERTLASSTMNSNSMRSVVALHTSWHHYMSEALLIGHNMENLRAKIKTTWRNDAIEMVGAFVEVVRCDVTPNVVGVRGVVTNETSKIWIVLRRARKTGTKRPPKVQRGTIKDCGDREGYESETQVEDVLIPKAGTILDAVIPSDGLPSGGSEISSCLLRKPTKGGRDSVVVSVGYPPSG